MRAIGTRACPTPQITGPRSISRNARICRFFRQPPHAHKILVFAVRGTLALSSARASSCDRKSFLPMRAPKKRRTSPSAHKSRTPHAGQCFGHFASSRNVENRSKTQFLAGNHDPLRLPVVRGKTTCFFRTMLLRPQDKNTAPAD